MVISMTNEENGIGPLPWERQINMGETARQFSAFCAYRDIPAHNRTYKKATEIIYPGRPANYPNVTKWANTYGWAERAAAYDEFLDRIHLAEMEEQRIEYRKRELTLSKLAHSKLVVGLKNLNEENLTASEIVSLHRMSRESMSTAVGEPTDIQRIEHEGLNTTPMDSQKLPVIQVVFGKDICRAPAH